MRAAQEAKDGGGGRGVGGGGGQNCPSGLQSETRTARGRRDAYGGRAMCFPPVTGKPWDPRVCPEQHKETDVYVPQSLPADGPREAAGRKLDGGPAVRVQQVPREQTRSRGQGDTPTVSRKTPWSRRCGAACSWLRRAQ